MKRAVKRRTKAQIEQERAEKERNRAEKERLRAEKEREKRQAAVRKKQEAEHREWLRKQRSRPRIQLPSNIPGEFIYVHQRMFDSIMKHKKIQVTSSRVVGGAGGHLVLEYQARGTRGVLELKDLGPMPEK